MKRIAVIICPLMVLVAAGWFWLGRPPVDVPAVPEPAIGPAWEDTRNPIAKLFKGKRLDLWSLKPIQDHTPPTVQEQSWQRGDVDRFILAKLESEGLKPAPEAGRRALARRLFFDLTGLPPTPEDVEAFVKNEDARAYDALVERLLASREFGEHWARWWLDFVRYSDSNGYDWDEFRPQAWRYRDYVIRSLNADKPLDRFIREQLAGDEMIPGPPCNEEEQDCLTATGYLRIGPYDNSAAKFGEEQRARANLTADLVETTGAAFLGLTLSCSRCHDHKTEPISQADHYRMRAFFETVKFRDDMPLDLASEQEAIKRFNEPIQPELDAAQQAASDLLLPTKKILLKNHPTVPDEFAVKFISEAERPAYNLAMEKVKAVRARMKKFTLGLCMTDGSDLQPATRILSKGDPDQPGEAVEPGFLSVLDPRPAVLAKPVNPNSSGRRTTLANWMLAEENPLTSRVLANRIWLGVFGSGIVSTPNDFGLSGARPSHPELLDWLATDLRRQKWSLKAMLRQLVTSATYRQSTDHPALNQAVAKDAENRLHWRHDLRRLTAEQLRDAMLSVSGKLKPHAGGPPLWPTLPDDVLLANPALLNDNAAYTKGWYPSPPESMNVRSIYLIQKRSVRIPFMETFDLPDNFTTCAVRNVSTIAPQALTLLNGPFILETAHAFADRLAGDKTGEADAKVSLAFRLALQREAPASEQKIARMIAQQDGLVELSRLVFNLNEFIYVD